MKIDGNIVEKLENVSFQKDKKINRNRIKTKPFSFFPFSLISGVKCVRVGIGWGSWDGLIIFWIFWYLYLFSCDSVVVCRQIGSSLELDVDFHLLGDLDDLGQLDGQPSGLLQIGHGQNLHPRGSDQNLGLVNFCSLFIFDVIF